MLLVSVASHPLPDIRKHVNHHISRLPSHNNLTSSSQSTWLFLATSCIRVKKSCPRCHSPFLHFCRLFCLCALSHSVVSTSLWPHGLLCSPLFMGFSRQEYWSGSHFLLQDIFLTQGSNPHLLRLLHQQADSLSLAPPGKPVSSCLKWRGWIKIISRLPFSSKVLWCYNF